MDRKSAVGGVPTYIQQVGFAADLAVLHVLLAAACGFIHKGVVPLPTPRTLVSGFSHASFQTKDASDDWVSVSLLRAPVHFLCSPAHHTIPAKSAPTAWTARSTDPVRNGAAEDIVQLYAGKIR